MDENKNYLLYAETAFSNKQYMEALSWYKKVLESTPDNVYVLSRAGAISVSMSQFAQALVYFKRAKELDPENGDNSFNYGNACFFNQDYIGAFAQYVDAEKAGCSEEIVPRLYYQLAMICSIRQDIKSALVYFKKCEDADKNGIISLNPDLVSEKLKLYMMLSDYSNAQKCAAQLVAINPLDLKNYMVYFSLLMAQKDYATAERVLDDASKYAELSEDAALTLILQKAALYVSAGESNTSESHTNMQKAVSILKERYEVGNLTSDQNSQLLLTLGETYFKAKEYDKSIAILASLLNGNKPLNVETDKTEHLLDDHELSSEEIEAMIMMDMERIQEKINNGEIDGEMGAYAATDYDEMGNLVHYYDESAFSSLSNASVVEKDTPAERNQEPYELPIEIREKVIFTLLSCYMAKEDFCSAQKFANVLRHSENKYYSYFGLYSVALAEKMITGNSDLAQRKYSEAIAFFRNKSFSDPSDTLATIFRARLYAEQKKYAKATELAHLLADADRKSVLDYIEQCKQT